MLIRRHTEGDAFAISVQRDRAVVGGNAGSESATVSVLLSVTLVPDEVPTTLVSANASEDTEGNLN